MRLIDAEKLRAEYLGVPNCYNGFSDTYDKAMIVDMVDEQPTIKPLTEIDYIELADRYGGEVAFVVKDMIEQTGRRWGNEEPKKMDDVVKVVRCKDCKWWGKNYCVNRNYSIANTTRKTIGEDYCSWGERKDDE